MTDIFSILPKKVKTVVYSKRDVALEKSTGCKTLSEEKQQKQSKTPIKKKTPTSGLLLSPTSDEIGAPGCNWWINESETGNSQQPEIMAPEIYPEKIIPANGNKNSADEEGE